MNFKSTIGKPLHEAIKGLDCNVKIGSKSGYVFCGKPTAIELHEIDGYCIEKCEKSIESEKKELRVLVSELKELEKKIQNKTQSLYKKQDALKARPHLLKRKVLDVYKSISEENTYCMIVEGDEVGDYWTVDEYKSKEAE